MPAGGNPVANAPTRRSSNDDVRALDLIQASGVLNPNLTLDKLMHVTRELTELQPPTEADQEAFNVFIHRFYCLRHQPYSANVVAQPDAE
jgi:hypothetical protein